LDTPATHGTKQSRSGNKLLTSIPERVLQDLQLHLEPIKLPMGLVLHEPGEASEYVYFPHSGVMSMLTVLASGDAIEIASIGREGMADVTMALGAEVAGSRLVVQTPGHGRRVRTVVIRDLLERHAALREMLAGYLVSIFSVVAQSAACNQRHSAQQRCARWLLMTHDRLEEGSFPMTQEFLSGMLGVRRATVTGVVAELERAGFIHHRRGRVWIIDRPGLETAACECYAVMNTQLEALAPNRI